MKSLRQHLRRICRDALRSSATDPFNALEQLGLVLVLKLVADENRAGTASPEMAVEDGPYTWSSWATLPSEAVARFVADEVFPYMQSLVYEAPDLAELFRDTQLRDPVLGLVPDLVGVLSGADLATPRARDAVAAAFRDLVDAAGESDGGRGGQVVTPSGLRRLMVALAELKPGLSVIDPACGTGSFLLEAAREMGRPGAGAEPGEPEPIRGIDVFAPAARLATISARLHGRSEIAVFRGDSVTMPGLARAGEFDRVLTTPPFGARVRVGDHREDLRHPAKRSEEAFLEMSMRLLSPGGRAVVLLPVGVLWRGGALERIRMELLEQFDLRAVVAVPSRALLPYTAIETVVLVFDRPVSRGGAAGGAVWFHEMEGTERRRGRASKLDVDGALTAWRHSVEQRSTPVSDRKVRSWSVAQRDLIADGGNLSPDRSRPRVDPRHDFEHASVIAARLHENEERVVELVAELRAALEDVDR